MKDKVLIAEDEVGHLIPIKDYLEDKDFEIIWVKDIEELNEKAQDADIIIVDVRLPMKFGDRVVIDDNNGIKAVAELFNNNQLKPKTPLIFISMYTETEDVCQKELRKWNIKPECYRWLQKPFEMESLTDRIYEQLKVLRS